MASPFSIPKKDGPTHKCEECDGTGKKGGKECPMCHGSGKMPGKGH